MLPRRPATNPTVYVCVLVCCCCPQQVEAIDAFLGGFVASERKQRARLKLNYVIAGASTNRLDQSIRLLADSDEIDDSLLAFIDRCVVVAPKIVVYHAMLTHTHTHTPYAA